MWFYCKLKGHTLEAFYTKNKPGKNEIDFHVTNASIHAPKQKCLQCKSTENTGIFPKADYKCNLCKYTCSKRETSLGKQKHDGVAPMFLH